MLTLKEVQKSELPQIRDLALRIWPNTFGEILSPQQIEYMLEMMYSIDTLNAQWEKGHVFLVAELEGEALGFIAFEHNYQTQAKAKIHKIYLLPESQGKGVGRTLIEAVAERAIQKGEMLLSLNVNRFNKATRFYEKVGFSIVGEENIDIGQGFLMEDYIMEKPLSRTDV
ncbi:GNAT family N-acetyltransferase [Marinilongibacter aquaticus]|uniref:GNAT family N-acetyltransferase n=1 Tax=Marinilongibacter aquaticus TaxID=2975157 RepID=UPI0021BD0479|nr:GNAT family N-acetyltransferase [Marinilongibacter aquaticus]UBM58155.1 GNAT family N-acetyltransferase [Marinilongibacter aquaticus]